MCEVKPGPRCATDTRDAAASRSAEYEATHPGGPAVDPISAAQAQTQITQAQGHHRMLTESCATRLDVAMRAAQGNVREARAQLRQYGRHTSHGTVLGQRLRDVEQGTAEMKALGSAAPATGVDGESFFAAMKTGPVGAVPGPQELPPPEPADRPEGLTAEQRHLSMLIATQVQHLDGSLRVVDNRLRDARSALRQGEFQSGDGQLLGQVGQDADEASARLVTLLEVAPVMGLDDRAVRHAYYTGLSRFR